MSRKPSGEFGQPTGPGFADLRTANGQLVVAALSEWRQFLDKVARDTPDENLGYERVVYLVPTAIARGWASLYSIDKIAQHAWDGAKVCRLRGVVKLDDRLWTPVAQDELTKGGKGHTTLCELIPAERIGEGRSLPAGPMSYPQRISDEWKRALGSNFYGVGPLLGKTGKEQYAMGYNVRVLAIDSLKAGKWYRVELPPDTTW